MQKGGWPAARVRKALDAARADDLRFDTGQVLGSMCTAPDALAAEAFDTFLETNLGDPGHFPGTARLEREVLADLVGLLGGGPRAEGRLLSGGTEANLLACYVAREATGKSRIVAPESAHFSFEKAARMLRMDLVLVPTQGHRADPKAMAAAVDGDTALMVAVAGTTELGLVDPVAALADACRERGLRLHVDAAFGGYLLPFVAGAPPFDLRVPGVTSVALDPHKAGLAPIPAGALVLADGADWGRTAVPSPYVSTATQSIILGTRPGAAAAATWAAHRHLGRDGYARNARRCMQVARELARGLEAMGRELVAQPELTVVTFRDRDPRALAQRLLARGFGVNVVPRFQAIRIVVNPHVTSAVVQRFLETLAAVDTEKRGGAGPGPAPQRRQPGPPAPQRATMPRTQPAKARPRDPPTPAGKKRTQSRTPARTPTRRKPAGHPPAAGAAKRFHATPRRRAAAEVP